LKSSRPGANLQPKLNKYLFAASLFAFALLAGVPQARAQALPTATANYHISVFGGVAGDFTGLGLAKNGDITAGFDFGIRSFAGFFPSLEVRGLYPVAKGQTVNTENAAVGVRLARHKNNLHGYGDVLFGRGKLNFPGGYPNPTDTFNVLSNTSDVLSFGGGAEYFFSTHWGVQGDFQLQRYQTPVTVSGNLFSKVFSGSVVYRFGNGGLNGLRGRRF
jgi:hypothetical protein